MENKLLEQRLKKIFEYAKDVDALLIMQGDENSVDKTFFYITDPDGGIFESSALIVKPDNVKILTSQLEEEIAKRTGMDVIVTKGMIDLKWLVEKALDLKMDVRVLPQLHKLLWGEKRGV